uniref:Phosphoglycerate mutase n=1 Tax=Corethron hystrix TaxID=216773 RepID=A0A7S1FU90_9STRA|mmetsp:Transcript_32441/g.74685  ORF Transcript_32441/g.74685 Transcript_32441/m.74685 type:complete len:157 (+) Transcript_32441:1231-1701(+)
MLMRLICLNVFQVINIIGHFSYRRDRHDLMRRFPSWDFSSITPYDETWTDTLESESDCRERGYQSLLWASQQKEDGILMVTHGGLLRFTLADHENVVTEFVNDKCDVVSTGTRNDAKDRFENCELRAYEMSWDDNDIMERPVFTMKELCRSTNVIN